MDNAREVYVRLQNARDVKENWEANNPVLLPGEIALVYNVGNDPADAKIKMGDGITPFSNLPFYEETDKVRKELLGKPNGLATLDEDGKIPVSQLPTDLYGTCTKIVATLSRLGWHASGNDEYPYVFSFYNDAFTEEINTEMFVDAEYASLANKAGLKPEVDTEMGSVKILARTIPENHIKVIFILGQVDALDVESHVPINWLGYYGSNTDVFKLPGYDILILESDQFGTLTAEQKGNKKCLGYIAIAEVVQSRWFYDAYCKGKSFLVEENTGWSSYRCNPASSEWQNILLNVVAPKVFEKGFDGVFFDTCDVAEYLEGTYPGQYTGAVQGTVDIINAFKAKWPDKIIACNGGYAPIIQAKDSIDYYVVESAIGTWRFDQDRNVIYTNTEQESKDWLYPRITNIQNQGISILDWEYGEVANEDRVYEIMQEADSKGWNPFVTVRSIQWFPGLPIPDESAPKPPAPLVPAEGKISFVAATAAENVNFFAYTSCELPDTEKFKVYINDEETQQSYTSISFAANDKIDIQLIDNTSYYPIFKAGHWDTAKVKDYVKEILEPFPKFYASASGWAANDFANQFTFCKQLKTVPEGLYKNNPQATTFYYCFAQTGVTAVPEKFFEGCSEVTTFEACFIGCTSLVSVANDLFEYSVKATRLTDCLSNDHELYKFALKIGSPNITKVNGFVTAHWQATTAIRKVIVPADSVTEATFRSGGFDGALGIETY